MLLNTSGGGTNAPIAYCTSDFAVAAAAALAEDVAATARSGGTDTCINNAAAPAPAPFNTERRLGCWPPDWLLGWLLGWPLGWPADRSACVVITTLLPRKHNPEKDRKTP